MITIFGLFLCVCGYIFLSWLRRHIRVNNITQRHVLITGCDTGFGHMLAQRLDMLGMPVFATCLTDAGKRRLREVCSSRLKTITMDVRKVSDIQQTVDYVKANLPQGESLWALVNNAGTMGSVMGPPEWLCADDFTEVMDTNAIGMVRVTLAFLPLLKESQGRLINMSNMNGRFSLPMNLPYCMSKFAVEAFSDGLRAHLAQWGVTVHILEPGSFQTNIIGRDNIKLAVQQGWDKTSRSIKEEFGRDYLENLQRFLENNCEKGVSPKVNKVINCYVHALTARCPRQRYSIGWDSHFIWLPLSYAPSVIQDLFMGRMLTSFVPAAITRRFTSR